MLAGCALFAGNDVMGKWLVSTYSVGQLLLIRSIAAMVVLAPFIARAGLRTITRVPRPGLHTVRVIFATAEVALFYWAVAYLPLADVVVFYLAGPIFVTTFSALLLHEQVDGPRWAAVLIGFVGVIIAMRPTTAALGWPALIALGGSLTFSLSMVTTRLLRGTPDLVLISWQTMAALVFGVVAAPFVSVTPSPRDAGLLALLGIVALLAHACVNRSLKLASAVVVVPYQYTLIVWAMIFGYVVFGDAPTPSLLLGTAIIVAAGLFIFVREGAEADAPSRD